MHREDWRSKRQGKWKNVERCTARERDGQDERRGDEVKNGNAARHRVEKPSGVWLVKEQQGSGREGGGGHAAGGGEQGSTQ